MAPKLSNLKKLWIIGTKTLIHVFVLITQNKLDNFGVILLFSFSYKKCYNVLFMKLEKSMQKSIFPQKIQKSLCITTKGLYTNSNFKRNYLENYYDSDHAVISKNAPFLMIFPNISFFHMDVTDRTCPFINC